MNLATGILFKHLDEGSVGIRIEGELLKKCQKVLLSMAEDFISMCEHEGIWYELGGGTALGAVRHGGFIPWDDDVDINIKSKDFEKLGGLVEKYYPGKYAFIDHTTPDYAQVMGRFVLKNTAYSDRITVDSEHKGFFIDIFTIENVPDNAILRRIHGIICMISGGLLSCRNFYRSRKVYLDILKRAPSVKKVVWTKMFIGFCISFISCKGWGKITRKIYSLCKNEQSKFVSIPSGRKHYFGEMYEREDMMETLDFPFEGHKWMVAKNYGNYFTVLYGHDYMIPHSPKKREVHMVLELKFPDDSK